MRSLPLTVALAAACALLVFPADAAPTCPPPGAGGQSPNWGPHFDVEMTEAFNTVLAAAKDPNNRDPDDPATLPQNVTLIAANNTSPQNRNRRMIGGTPLGAVPAGTIPGVADDAVFYTFGIFELSCSRAQLAFFLAHEMRHLMRGPDGRSHFQRVNDCTNGLYDAWKAVKDPDGSRYPSSQKRQEAFTAEKGAEVSVKCVLPVEQQADKYAFGLVPKLLGSWGVGGLEDAENDPRVRAFKNEERWLDALGLAQSDPGHGTAADRAQAMEAKARAASEARQRKAEEAARQSLPRTP